MPPSVEALGERLTLRGEDTQESIAKRLSEAKLDMSQAQHFDYLVVNQDFDTAIQDFVAIVRAARLQKTVQLQQPAVHALVHFDG